MAPISPQMLRCSRNENHVLTADLSAFPTNAWKMDLLIVLDTLQTYFMNILTFETLLSKVSDWEHPLPSFSA